MKQSSDAKIYYYKRAPKLVLISKITGDDSLENLKSTHVLNMNAKRVLSLSEYTRYGGRYFRKSDVHCYDNFFVVESKVVEDGFSKISYKAYDYDGALFHECAGGAWNEQNVYFVQNIKNKAEERE